MYPLDIQSSLQRAFEENFASRDEIGASVSVWQNGKEIVTLSKGWSEREKIRPWGEQTLSPVYSVSKVPAATTFLLALRESGFSSNNLVRKVWPKLPVGDLTFAKLLSHQAGLPGLREPVSVTEREQVISLLESTEPFWVPGTRHGYHARTIGFILDELCLRLHQRRLGELWRLWIGDPLEIDFWIGLPKEKFPQVATLYPGRYIVRKEERDFYAAMQTEGSVARKAFGSLQGCQSASEMNRSEAWTGGYPAFGGVGSARGLAKFYQAVLGKTEKEVIPQELRNELATRILQGRDETMCLETSFGPGTMFDPLDGKGEKIRALFGPNVEAFGHPGAGGSHAFCDPTIGLSFAYTMNQMELGLFPGERGLSLVRSVYE